MSWYAQDPDSASVGRVIRLQTILKSPQRVLLCGVTSKGLTLIVKRECLGMLSSLPNPHDLYDFSRSVLLNGVLATTILLTYITFSNHDDAT